MTLRSHNFYCSFLIGHHIFVATTFKGTVLGLPQRLRLENLEKEKCHEIYPKIQSSVPYLRHFRILEQAVTFQKSHILLGKHFLPRHHI
jgi:hypothetical protein